MKGIERMILYHGTKNRARLNSILRYGFHTYDGYHGHGVYFAESKMDAQMHAIEDWGCGNGDPELVVQVSVPDDAIAVHDWVEWARLLGVKPHARQNPSIVIEAPLPGLQQWVLDNGYHGAGIRYCDGTEYVLYRIDLVNIMR